MAIRRQQAGRMSQLLNWLQVVPPTLIEIDLLCSAGEHVTFARKQLGLPLDQVFMVQMLAVALMTTKIPLCGYL
ncbi:hypothetical protein D9M68_860340 [compost metagenome]